MDSSNKQKGLKAGDKATVSAAQEILSGKKKAGRLANLLPFLGSAPWRQLSPSC
jgi:hypothetical protein